MSWKKITKEEFRKVKKEIQPDDTEWHTIVEPPQEHWLKNGQKVLMREESWIPDGDDTFYQWRP